MNRLSPIAFLFALSTAFAGGDSFAGGDLKWQLAGESQGITFHLRIHNQCKEGSKLTIRLKSALDHSATVSFRLSDSDWRKTFTHKVPAGGKETTLTYVPVDGPACHPFLDQVSLEDEGEAYSLPSESPAESP